MTRCHGHSPQSLVIDACKRDFREVYDLLNGNFSAIEEETFKNYKIFQEI